jgi:hypothetical protein
MVLLAFRNIDRIIKTYFKLSKDAIEVPFPLTKVMKCLLRRRPEDRCQAEVEYFMWIWWSGSFKAPSPSSSQSLDSLS